MSGSRSHPTKITRDTRLGVLTIYALRVMPAVLASCYAAYYLLMYFGIDVAALSVLGAVSLLPLCFMYLCSYAFKFCAYHRVFLHYILIVDCLEYWEMGSGLPLSLTAYRTLPLLLFVPTVVAALYYYVRRKQAFVNDDANCK